MNAVFADAAAGHDDQVAGFDFFLMRWFSVDARGHDAGGAAINQRFAQESFVKNNAAVDRGNAAFVSAVFHAFAHAFVNAARMKNARRQFLFMKRRGKAEDIGIENQFCAQAGAERIAVDADNAGERSAVGIKGGRRIMRFHFENQIVIIVEFDYSGIIHKHGKAEIFFAFGFADFCRGTFDIGFEKRINGEFAFGRRYN